MATVTMTTLVMMMMAAILLGHHSAQGIHSPDLTVCDAMPDGKEAYQPPDFKDSFRVMMERKIFDLTKDPADISVLTEEMFFSQQYGGAHIRTNSLDQGVNRNVWAVSYRNSLVTEENKNGVATCTVQDLLRSKMGSRLSVSVDEDNKYKMDLGLPIDALEYGPGIEFQYVVGPTYLEDRGIYTTEVYMCAFHEESGYMRPSRYYFSDPQKSEMNAGPDRTFLVRAEIDRIFKNNTNQDKERFTIDYTGFDFDLQTVIPQLFLTRPNAFCDFSKSTNNSRVPTVADNIQFSVMSTIHTAVGSNIMEQFKFTFLNSLGLSIRESVSTGVDQDQQVDLQLQDFNAGIQFTLNRVTGECLATGLDIDTSGGVFISGSGNQINTGLQFLGLNQNAMDEGVMDWRNNRVRAFSVKNDKLTLLFYFVYKVDKVVPFGIDRVSAEETTSYAITQYTDQVNFQAPDISSCATPDQLLNVQFVLSAPYHTLVTPDIPSFRRGLIMTIFETAGTNLASRIPRVNFFPWSTTETMVQVAIMDKLKVEGVTYPKTEVSNDQIFSNLQKSIDSNAFTVTVYRSNGQASAAAKPGSFGKYTPRKGNPRYVGPVPNLCASSSDSGSYDGSDMAGLAFGMMFLTVVLTLVMVFLLYKFKFSTQAGGSMRME